MSKTNSRKRALEWPYPRYKKYQRELRKVATEWFREKDYPVSNKYSFLLANRERDWRCNIILDEVVNYIEAEIAKAALDKRAYPLHQHIHNGMSSQAMLFNLIGPLIVRDDYSPLKAAVSKSGISWPDGPITADFEVSGSAIFKEEVAQPTSIDLVIKGGEANDSLFIEAKLSENEFGGCKIFEDGDCNGANPSPPFDMCYLQWIYRTYWDQMQERGLLDGLLGSSPFCPFASHYQFFRELLFALHEGGSYVLLYDPRNPTFLSNGPFGERGLFLFLVSFLPDDLKSRVSSLSIDQVFKEIVESDLHDDWTGEFTAKYYGVDRDV